MAGGRKRQFDRDEALDAAMRVFWRKGFSAASLSDLTSAMGINKPSMYGTFGNKEALFVAATEHYLNAYAAPHGKQLERRELELKDRVRAYMKAIVTNQCGALGELGCYISLCVSEQASECLPDAAVETVAKAQSFGETALIEYFRGELEHLPKSATPERLALRILTVLHGTAALARGGRKMDELEALIDDFVDDIFAQC